MVLRNLAHMLPQDQIVIWRKRKARMEKKLAAFNETMTNLKLKELDTESWEEIKESYRSNLEFFISDLEIQIEGTQDVIDLLNREGVKLKDEISSAK